MYGKILTVLVATTLIFILGIQVGLSKEESALDTSETMRKLDKILLNQTEILKQFEEVRQELVIIKIRASR